MNLLRKLVECLFPSDSGDIDLPLLAIVTATLSSGVVAIVLWIVHSTPALPASDVMPHDCLERCEKMCNGQIR